MCELQPVQLEGILDEGIFKERLYHGACSGNKEASSAFVNVSYSQQGIETIYSVVNGDTPISDSPLNSRITPSSFDFEDDASLLLLLPSPSFWEYAATTIRSKAFLRSPRTLQHMQPGKKWMGEY
jgi:hypothetical protein